MASAVSRTATMEGKDKAYFVQKHVKEDKVQEGFRKGSLKVNLLRFYCTES